MEHIARQCLQRTAREEIHSVSVAELAAKLGFDSKNEEYLKDTLKSLRKCVKSNGNILRKDKKQEWGVAGLLAEARIVDGICYYEYSPSMRQRLHNPRIYSKLNLHLQNEFKSRYTLILWEVCFDYFDTAPRSRRNPVYSTRNLPGVDGNRGRRIYNIQILKSVW